MKDRFRFRAWDKEHSKMELFEHESGIQYQFGSFDISSGWNSDDDPTYYKDVNDNYILMQCTGLKDKNGKLIFEGDILKETKIKINWDKTEWYTISCVFWDRTQFQLGHYKTTGRARVQRNKRLDRLVEPKCKFAFCDYTPIKDFVNAEIIGNIYENPELLEGGE